MSAFPAYDNRPIGVFDSGLGGLTAVKELTHIFPNENIIYFGDTGRVPYGTRSNETIVKYVRQDIRFLMSHNVKAIVAACGTASSVALEQLKPEFNLPLIGVLEPVCRAAISKTKNEIIGVLGTPGTINSGSYSKGIRSLNPSAAVIEQACPMFVPLVENGYLDHEATYLFAKEYLKPLIEQNADTIILGCTHYPLLEKVIKELVGDNVSVINAGAETALYTKKILEEQMLLSNATAQGQNSYFVSDDVEKFSHLGGMFLGRKIEASVTKIDIDTF
ncbi:MAG: glutamate racemase [Clostridia bacterium]|nr:glutamate racemase [Clostridia bacterium]